MTGKEEKDLTATTTPPPEEREQKPVEMPQETKDELLEQALESLASNKNLNPQLGDAIGMTKKWQERHEKNLQDVKKICFKDNDEMFKEWNARNANSYIRHRDSLIRYEQSQARQLIKVQNEENRKRLEEGSRSATIMANNASLSELAERRHTIQSEYEGELNTTKKQWEEFRNLKEREVKEVAEAAADDPELAGRQERAKNELGEKALEYQKRGEIIQSKKETALAAAKKEYDDQMAANRETLRKWYTDSLAKETKFQMSQGYDEKTAFMLAVSEIGKDSQAMLQALVDAGQGDFVQTFLDEIGTGEAGLKKVQRMQDGKPVKGKDGKDVYDWEWNPNGRLCMSLKQVNEVKDYLNSKIASDISARKLATQQQDRAFDVEASRIRVTADELNLQPELDLDKMKQLMDAAKALQDAGYEKAYQVTSHLVTIVKSAERKSAKLANDAAKLETEADFQRECNEFKKYMNFAAPLAVCEPGSERAKIIVAKMVDGQNRMILLIRNGISRGILKTQYWKDALADLESARAIEDKKAAAATLADLGITIDQTMTREWQDDRSKRGVYIQDSVPGIPFEAHDNNKDERQIHIKDAGGLVYKWTDPDTGNVFVMSGDTYNDLAEVVANWQRRHVNPSPTDEAVPKELRGFVLSVLKKARTQQTIHSIWPFISDKKAFGFADISLVGKQAIHDYFNPTTIDASGKKVYDTRLRYDRDMEALRAATTLTPMPSLGSLRQIVESATGVE